MNNFSYNFQNIVKRLIWSFKNLPITTKSGIVVLLCFYILHKITDLSGLVLMPMGSGFNPVQLLTYPLLQVDFFGLLFSVIALWFFAAPIERHWGVRRFLIYVLVAVLSAGVFHITASGLFLMGLSGVIYSLLLAYGMMWPEQRIQLLLPPIPVKGKYLVLVFGILMALGYLQNSWGRWVLLSYLVGAFCCYLMIQFWRQKPPFIRSKKSHLKRIK